MRRLEDAGIAVSPAAPGCAFFETRGVERLYGGVEPALQRALAAVGPVGTRASVRPTGSSRRSRRRTSRSPGQVARRLATSGRGEFLAPLPLALLPLAREQHAGAEGARRAKAWSSLPGFRVVPLPNVWGRTAGAPGAWREEGTAGACAAAARRAELVERLEFPEAVGNELTLRRAFGVAARPAARAARAASERFVRKVALAARLVGGGSWRRTITLRDPSDRARPAPRRARRRSSRSCRRRSLELRLELVELTESTGSSSSSCSRAGPSSTPGSAKACARCGRAPARAPCTPSWRWRRGRAYRKHARCSFRRTTERAEAGARRGERSRQSRGT